MRELSAIFGERDRGGAPCQRVRKLAAEKLVAVEERLRDLQSWRRELRTTLADWDRLLRKTPRGKRAGLLESFVATHPTNGPTNRAKNRSSVSRGDVLVRGRNKREKQR